MSLKIKMNDIRDDRDGDIIELPDEEPIKILADDDFDDSEEHGEIHSFVFPIPTLMPRSSLAPMMSP